MDDNKFKKCQKIAGKFSKKKKKSIKMGKKFVEKIKFPEPAEVIKNN